MENALIVVAKEPLPGRTKTRLCPPLVAREAVELCRCLLVDTVSLMARLRGAARPYFEALGPPDFYLALQQGANLGERLAHALGHHFRMSYRRVAIMNGDGPTPASCLPGRSLCRAGRGRRHSGTRARRSLPSISAP
jgi:glycosyltransferase A (GT-A) superfamily protein (DUF2064 family)